MLYQLKFANNNFKVPNYPIIFSELLMSTGEMLVPVAVILCVAMYFLPFLIADHRKHKKLPVIFGVNLLLGWTVIGWAVAMVWAFSTPENASDSAKNQSQVYSEES
ncbi:superinfection immunity protein [Rouxiella badensis]|jgi:hypothetical protein|uniref:Superinfection immunity protein n=2 Tax=Rouxiella badensis TaxID=1646377 RepID=A0A1X0WD67_9GAMM|nr:superinfection immunity protein [Rouxiella badensis]MCC3701384.1 superinfection immunity protein [Rouxiella badensis]MCC3717811.1 superinfection immunity protein [Rouxiella badensis]MCC3727245.1 superinfection immunity protein [Rouxiella badensis]MCC3735062.1 superinfection immunity protein [Rouxiella badensis]MCC3739154.1 superinfection immunity protein [Rouxiella badensis]